MKEVFLDVGELGWSFYLSAHMRWLKENNCPVPAVMVLSGREALYENIASTILKVPDEFYKDFFERPQDCFTLYGMSGMKLRNYFNLQLPENYVVSKSQPLDCHGYNQIYVGKMLFTSYSYETKLRGKREILVFPRARMASPFRQRNLPKAFYITLINRLCEEFKHLIIRTIGTKTGAYDITEIQKSNYINFVGKTPTIQAIIDRCQIAICSIGGTSSLPKLAMLQGVPSFIIGHEPERFRIQENWRNTKMEFFFVSKGQYSNFDFGNCIAKIISLIKEVQ